MQMKLVNLFYADHLYISPSGRWNALGDNNNEVFLSVNFEFKVCELFCNGKLICG